MKYCKVPVLILVFLLGFQFQFVHMELNKTVNNRPIIGVLVQESSVKLRKYGKEILPASYVKFIEASGGRAAPILIGKPYEYYEKMFYSINGLLMTGGWVSPTDSGYGYSAKILTNLAKLSNKRGDVFPVWGTCLGFQALAFIISGHDVLESCETWDMVSHLNFTKGYKRSKLFGAMPKEMRKDMATLPIAVNYHHSCLTYRAFKENKMDETIKLLSTNHDYEGSEFVSTMEAKEYPFFATQWHPEKIIFEFVSRQNSLKNTPHFSKAVEIAQWLSRFFIDYARQSSHSFPTVQEEESVLIYNYQATFSAVQGSMYEQIYVITSIWFTTNFKITLMLIVLALLIFYAIFLRKGRYVSLCCSSYFTSTPPPSKKSNT